MDAKVFTETKITKTVQLTLTGEEARQIVDELFPILFTNKAKGEAPTVTRFREVLRDGLSK